MTKLRIAVPPVLGTEPGKRLRVEPLLSVWGGDVWHRESSGQYVITMSNL